MMCTQGDRHRRSNCSSPLRPLVLYTSSDRVNVTHEPRLIRRDVNDFFRVALSWIFSNFWIEDAAILTFYLVPRMYKRSRKEDSTKEALCSPFEIDASHAG